MAPSIGAVSYARWRTDAAHITRQAACSLGNDLPEPGVVRHSRRHDTKSCIATNSGSIAHSGGINTKSTYKGCLPAFVAVFAFSAITAMAQPSSAAKEDKAQMKSDQAALQVE